MFSLRPIHVVHLCVYASRSPIIPVSHEPEKGRRYPVRRRGWCVPRICDELLAEATQIGASFSWAKMKGADFRSSGQSLSGLYNCSAPASSSRQEEKEDEPMAAIILAGALMPSTAEPRDKCRANPFMRPSVAASMDSLAKEDIPSQNSWTIPSFGGGPTLPSDVKVELQNRELWQQFHAETTEMVITKAGRRMFPSIQLTVTGLERRARYCVFLEMEPASDRRHKYVGAGAEKSCGNGRGWTSAGPAEPQPRIDRRIYLHPDSPATGAHWMQHKLSFNKLKLTNNAGDPKNNIVLTSMHKYIPRIWIIRCDDATKLNDLYSHPASSFKFTETEFITVTAYQNENITQLKIDNNPFAKGFREKGQSRCKRKFQAEVDESNHIDGDEDDENASSESESHRPPNHLEVPSQRPKTASSETGSLDDSGVSSSGGISPPLPSFMPQNSLSRDVHRVVQPRLHRPWIDSASEGTSSSSLTPTPSFSLGVGCFNLSAYYFRLFHPSFAMPTDFGKLPYQSIKDYSKLH